MAKNINIRLALKDQFTSPLNKAKGNTNKFAKEVKKAENKLHSFRNATVKTLKGLALLNLAGIGKLKDGIVNFSKESIEAAKMQLKVEKTLEENMKRTSNATAEQIEMIKKEASALQNVGVVGDEVALAGASQLAIYGLKSDAIKKLMPNLNDMIAKEKGLNGTQEDSIAMADIIGKALQGQTRGLLKYGVSLSENENKLFKNMTQQQKIDFISQKLTKSIGGTNKALRETDEGKIVAAKNAWGDMKEELGKKLLPYLGKIAIWFETKIPAIQDFILSIADKIAELIIKAQPYIELLKEILGRIFEKVQPAIDFFKESIEKSFENTKKVASFLYKHWDRLSPIIYSVGSGIVAYNIAMAIKNNLDIIALAKMKILNALSIIHAIVTGKMTIAQWALNTAMNANPIGFIIGVIAALIGVGWLLYKNLDLIKTKVSEFWNKLDNNPLGRLFKWFLRMSFPIILLIENFQLIKEKVLNFWEILKDKFIPIIEAISNPIETAKKAVGGLIDKLKFWDRTDPKDKELNIKENLTGGSQTPITENIPRHALGTSYFKGGLTGINEGRRNETAILPSGTKILSHEESKKANKNTSIVINLTVEGNVIGNREFMEKCGQHVVNKILLATNNS